MATLVGCMSLLLLIAVGLSSVDCLTGGNCSEGLLRVCSEGFDENSYAICKEAKELNNCLLYLSDCDHSKDLELKFIYRHLKFKVHQFSCNEKHPVKQCNESLVKSCLDNYHGNATPICPEVKRLQRCLDQFKGCHVMRHPFYTQSQSILSKNRKCFFLLVNYSRILEVLDKKTGLPKTINSTQPALVEKIETSSTFLPYTFVVVATVCTCLFLIVLVVFSVIRHTSLLRFRNSSIERQHTRLPSRPRVSSHRTNRIGRHNGHHNSRRPNVAIEGARQTVSGFFEGNVPPPPYSAVLDETESLRAGDPPPPYNVPQSVISIGVIV
ncbi:predicted protein [Nematostella vectensis]|uniref:Uncharacterized protein n=1 Tax=Nematostella vectensis TaxID=45351 RepID=A7RLD4_NEMVE|nr:uncharacterized protein LOC5519760 [Nematostella vectensis]EDO47585.1 predicted protein [Nematostella vectensis]|eukprot:XP_001639648.1 predicted protein [Nematostella vectensis]